MGRVSDTRNVRGNEQNATAGMGSRPGTAEQRRGERGEGNTGDPRDAKIRELEAALAATKQQLDAETRRADEAEARLTSLDAGTEQISRNVSAAVVRPELYEAFEAAQRRADAEKHRADEAEARADVERERADEFTEQLEEQMQMEVCVLGMF